MKVNHPDRVQLSKEGRSTEAASLLAHALPFTHSLLALPFGGFNQLECPAE
jgi:hypothetical protein